MRKIVLLAALPVLAAIFAGAGACRKSYRESQWQKKSVASIDLFDQGRYLDALPPAQDAARLAETAFGTEDIRTAYALDHLGKVYRRLGELEKARELFERAVKISSAVLDPDAPKRAHFLDNLAELLMTQGKYDEAEDAYQNSLHLMQRSFGELSSPVATAYARLAALYTRWGVYEEAEPLFRRLQDINYRVGSSDDAMDAAVAAGRCKIYLEDGRLDLAREQCSRALTLRERLPKNHLDLAQTLSTLGLLQLREGQVDEAQKSIQQAVDIYRLSPAADPQGLAEGWFNMAEVYAAQGRDSEAEQLFTKILPMFGNPYSQVKAATRVARYYQNRSRLDTAQSLYLQALARQASTPKADKQDQEALLVGLAQVSAGLGNNERASGFLERALKTNTALHGDFDPSSVDILAALARLKIAQHRSDQAERWLTRMRQVADTHGHESTLGKGVLLRMAKLYRDMGRKDKALRLEREAEAGS
jgi:tetratricopeptide (TPR) repeat protein